MSTNAAWICLIIAGLLEVVWAVGLKYTAGFTKLTPSVVTILAMAVSLYLLGKSVSVLPIGTAYGIWVGIGTVGAAVLGMVLFREPTTVARLVCLVMLITSLIGLKLTSTS